MSLNYDARGQPYNSANPAHYLALRTMHPSSISCLSDSHTNSVIFCAQLCEKEPDITDSAVVCFPNQTHPASNDSTHVTNEEEWMDSDNNITVDNKYTIDNTISVLDATTFQYYKISTRGTSASAAQILQQH